MWNCYGIWFLHRFTGHLCPLQRFICAPKISRKFGSSVPVKNGSPVPLKVGRGISRRGRELSWTSFTSKGNDPLGWGEPSWTSFTSKGYDPLGWGGRELPRTSFTSKGNDPFGWGGTIMDILCFQGVRRFRFGGERTIMDILYFQGVRPFSLAGGGNHHGHPLLPRGTTL